MPDINDLIQDDGDSPVRSEQEPAFGVPRDPSRRPWNGLGLDLREDTPSIQDWRPPLVQESLTKAEVWYATISGVLGALISQKKRVASTFAMALAITSTLATLIPSSYFATLHLYAPEKTDSVASRLQLFSNKIEFASFPVDFKIPLGLIARRLKSDTARNWVVKQYGLQASHISPIPINPDLVSAETFYAEGSELLVIQGYANDPQIAADVTNLYWDYLETEIKNMRQDNLTKVHRWIELTAVDWKQRLKAISAEILSMPAESYQERSDQLRNQLASQLSEAQLKKRRIEKEIAALRSAISSNSTSQLWAIADPEVQDLRRIDDALKNGPENQDKDRQELQERAHEVILRRLREKDIELASLTDQLGQVKLQMTDRASAFKTQSSLVAKQADLLRQQSDYIGRLEDLEKLKNQIDVESSLVHTRLRPIQAAYPDATTRRPNMILKYTIGTLMAFLITAILFTLHQRKKGTRRNRKVAA